jgi:hypothetical protein
LCMLVIAWSAPSHFTELPTWKIQYIIAKSRNLWLQLIGDVRVTVGTPSSWREQKGRLRKIHKRNNYYLQLCSLKTRVCGKCKCKEWSMFTSTVCSPAALPPAMFLTLSSKYSCTQFQTANKSQFSFVSL